MATNVTPNQQVVPVLPRVIALIASKTQSVIDSVVEQDYPNLEYTINTETPTPRFYNNIIEKTLAPNQIYLFLDDYNRLIGKDAVSKVVAGMSQFPALYTDIVKKNVGFTNKEYLPAFSQMNVLMGQAGINHAFFVRSEALPPRPFNERLEHLYLVQLFRDLASRLLIAHLPDFIIENTNNNQNLEKDIKTLNE